MRLANQWRKSSYSDNGANCVEVAVGTTDIGVRDTKDRAGGELAVPAQAWRAALARFQRD